MRHCAWKKYSRIKNIRNCSTGVKAWIWKSNHWGSNPAFAPAKQVTQGKLFHPSWSEFPCLSSGTEKSIALMGVVNGRIRQVNIHETCRTQDHKSEKMLTTNINKIICRFPLEVGFTPQARVLSTCPDPTSLLYRWGHVWGTQRGGDLKTYSLLVLKLGPRLKFPLEHFIN